MMDDELSHEEMRTVSDDPFLFPTDLAFRTMVESTAQATLVEDGASKIDLISLLAHQLISPLSVIDSSAQRLIRLSGKVSAAEIERRSQQIRAMTDELIALSRAVLSRMEGGSGQKTGLEPQICDLNDILLKACEHARYFQPRRVYQLETAPDLEPFRADPLLLEHLFGILLCNAAKYSPPETPVIVAARMDGGHVIIEVTDFGVGVPADEIKNIFLPFFRATNAQKHKGTGVGLSLAEKIARMHCGSITIRSTEGEGSTFTVKLPVTGPQPSCYDSAQL